MSIILSDSECVPSAVGHEVAVGGVLSAKVASESGKNTRSLCDGSGRKFRCVCATRDSWWLKTVACLCPAVPALLHGRYIFTDEMFWLLGFNQFQQV